MSFILFESFKFLFIFFPPININMSTRVHAACFLKLLLLFKFLLIGELEGAWLDFEFLDMFFETAVTLSIF